MIPAPDLTINGTATIDGVTLFAPLTLTLAAGQWTCLLGGSGVGKTTVLRLIAGLETGAAFAGEITASDARPVTERVSYMAQDDLLLPWATVAQNITLGARLRGEKPDLGRRDRLIERMRLQDHIAKKPSELSGGQRQRVALARTLMEDRPIVLLDEPFSALDARTRADMQDLAAEALQGRTVLLVTHDPGEAARLGQSIMVMTQHGLMSCQSPHASAPRRVDDLETLETQGALLRLLRDEAA
ncbi:ABC transporter ATP-binding protein [Rhodobacteraceae bacterium B1Z28]|uniref:ABC transporter ATP-binding protein n=1 Tax=Ruegeria haliotis TaxID=2747601 RepID=A0ABX2PPB0_9RHOB|nr:ABC transporter ATP-binding protein [Ruegeria haliotis]NVO55976.1 ABC transporter ATP-binding protein [Ruegeria haliotis]